MQAVVAADVELVQLREEEAELTRRLGGVSLDDDAPNGDASPAEAAEAPESTILPAAAEANGSARQRNGRHAAAASDEDSDGDDDDEDDDNDEEDDDDDRYVARLFLMWPSTCNHRKYISRAIVTCSTQTSAAAVAAGAAVIAALATKLSFVIQGTQHRHQNHEGTNGVTPSSLFYALRPAGGEADEEMDDDEAAAAGERLNAVYERLQEMGSATAEARAAKILHGLGVIQIEPCPDHLPYRCLGQVMPLNAICVQQTQQL